MLFSGKQQELVIWASQPYPLIRFYWRLICVRFGHLICQFSVQLIQALVFSVVSKSFVNDLKDTGWLTLPTHYHCMLIVALGKRFTNRPVGLIVV